MSNTSCTLTAPAADDAQLKRQCDELERLLNDTEQDRQALVKQLARTHEQLERKRMENDYLIDELSHCNASDLESDPSDSDLDDNVTAPAPVTAAAPEPLADARASSALPHVSDATTVKPKRRLPPSLTTSGLLAAAAAKQASPVVKKTKSDSASQ